jgi:hypothetical protein
LFSFSCLAVAFGAGMVAGSWFLVAVNAAFESDQGGNP